MAFVITEDHARQEAVYERLSYNRDASTIRRLLTETHVAATDRRAVFVGVAAVMSASISPFTDAPDATSNGRIRARGTA
jgi:ParB family chromosome partitioning protein